MHEPPAQPQAPVAPSKWTPPAGTAAITDGGARGWQKLKGSDGVVDRFLVTASVAAGQPTPIAPLTASDLSDADVIFGFESTDKLNSAQLTSAGAVSYPWGFLSEYSFFVFLIASRALLYRVLSKMSSNFEFGINF